MGKWDYLQACHIFPLLCLPSYYEQIGCMQQLLLSTTFYNLQIDCILTSRCTWCSYHLTSKWLNRFTKLKICHELVPDHPRFTTVHTINSFSVIWFLPWPSLLCNFMECSIHILRSLKDRFCMYLVFCHCLSHSHNAYQQCLPSSSVQSYRINIAKALWIRLRLWQEK